MAAAGPSNLGNALAQVELGRALKEKADKVRAPARTREDAHTRDTRERQTNKHTSTE